MGRTVADNWLVECRSSSEARGWGPEGWAGRLTVHHRTGPCSQQARSGRPDPPLAEPMSILTPPHVPCYLPLASLLALPTV